MFFHFITENTTEKARYHEAVYEINHFVLFRKTHIILHRLAWSCIVLHRLASSCIAPHSLTPSCSILHCLALSCIVLQCLASSCIVLHHLAHRNPDKYNKCQFIFLYGNSHINSPKKAQYHDAMNDTCYFMFVWKLPQKWPKKISTVRL